MIRHRLSLIAGAMLVLLSATAIPVHAQEWKQEIQVITPIKQGEPLSILLDSLVSTLEQNPDSHVRRASEDTTSIPYRTLEKALIAEGVDLRSASHALIRYRFDLAGHGMPMVETIEDLYFIFRFDESYADLPLLYLTTEDAAVHDVLSTSGIPSEVNMKSIQAFRRMVSFPILRRSHEIAVVEVGGKSLRNGLSGRQTQIVNFLDDYVSGDAGVYNLTTDHDHIAASQRSGTSAATVRTDGRW